ncbi:RrF2 family transcriptional regulator [Flavobacterium ardleyense]|uniref:RrF2 family transcriptional regulator n=1 Tax=Flavobacterium ardleyense TaxID=2038737 RepID=A0ABW5Z588_9FLAO
MFSKACEYGIKASIYIAEQSQLDRKVGLKEVSDAIESPAAYTSKILQLLSRRAIIKSDKGPTGGFSMDKNDFDNIKLCTIVEAIDGNDIYIGCGLGLSNCNERQPCPLHNQFKSIRNELKMMLENTTIKSLAEDFEKGLTFLKR